MTTGTYVDRRAVSTAFSLVASALRALLISTVPSPYWSKSCSGEGSVSSVIPGKGSVVKSPSRPVRLRNDEQSSALLSSRVLTLRRAFFAAISSWMTDSSSMRPLSYISRADSYWAWASSAASLALSMAVSVAAMFQ